MALYPARWATGIPRLPGLEHGHHLLADPYRYLSRRMAELGTDALQLRLLGQPTLCLVGAQAAALFYDDERMCRHGAAPEPLRATLFGKGGVQGLDDTAHRQRKSLFVELLQPPRAAGLVWTVRNEWLEALHRWEGRESVDLYRALQPVLTSAVCHWAGVRLEPGDLGRRTAELVSLFDDAGRGLAGHLRARLNRLSAEAWARGLITALRRGEGPVDASTPLARTAQHRDASGRLLPPGIAAVELLNLLRPVVASSVYMVFVAHALGRYPDWAEHLRGRTRGAQALHFLQEIRRHYPFFPLLAGRLRQAMPWRSAHLPAGLRVLLDIHGTHHHPASWREPDRFLPERWEQAPPPFAFLPQGAGDTAGGHHCPGDDCTLQLMLMALDVLLHHMRCELPRPPHALDFSRLPALPRGGLHLRSLRKPPF